MALRAASLNDLVSVLTNSTVDRVILVGAAISACAPSCLPDAVAWVSRVFADVAKRTGFESAASFDLLTRIDEATNRQAVPLEVLLTALDDASIDLGARIAASVAMDVPYNILHTILAEIAEQGRVHIVTTNFDTLLEHAYHALTGRPIDRWVIDDGPFDPHAVLLKVHGSGDRPQTLRHSLRRVNRAFDRGTFDGLQAVMSSDVVVLGYAGADFDVVEILEGNDGLSGSIYWLVTPDRIPSEAVRRISSRRDVFLVEGTFEGLLGVVNRPSPEYRPDGHLVWHRMSSEVEALSRLQATEVLTNVLYQARVAQPSAGILYADFNRFLSHQAGRSYRKLYHRSQASESQFDGGIGLGLIRACGHFILGSAPGFRWQAVSDATEVLERIGYGILAPVIRIFTWPIHWLAARHAVGVEHARLRLRFVHALSVLVGQRTTTGLLDEVLQETANDTYLEGAVYLRKAVAAALNDDNRWEDYIAKAQRDFLFEGRTVEIGDSLKLAAACAFITGGRKHALELLTEAESYQRRHGQAVGTTQARILRSAMRKFPRLSRLAIRFI
jgi:SIR2-like domain